MSQGDERPAEPREALLALFDALREARVECAISSFPVNAGFDEWTVKVKLPIRGRELILRVLGLIEEHTTLDVMLLDDNLSVFERGPRRHS